MILPDRDRIARELPELTPLRRWVCWRFDLRGDKRTPTKVPYCARDRKAKSTDPATWLSFDEAVALYRDGGFQGIGFVFAGQHVGIDFDHVIDAAGNLDPEAAQEIQALVNAGAYVDRSPSGTGVHAIGKYSGPPIGAKRGSREIYSHGRYFTMTGAAVPGVST